MLDVGELLSGLPLVSQRERPKPLDWPVFTRETDGETYLAQVKEVCRKQPTTLALVEALEAVALVGVAARQVAELNQSKQPLPISVGAYFIHLGRGDSMAEDREVRLRPHLAKEAARKMAAAESHLRNQPEANKAVSFLHLGQELLRSRRHQSGDYVNYQPEQLSQGFSIISTLGEEFGIPKAVTKGISWSVGQKVFGKDYQPKTQSAIESKYRSG